MIGDSRVGKYDCHISLLGGGTVQTLLQQFPRDMDMHADFLHLACKILRCLQIGIRRSGVIFKDSGTVRGMNTAATLWCTAAIGILASTGMYAMAITAAGILIASNSILRPLARKMNPITAGDEFEKQYRISVICQEAAEQEIRLLLINSNSCKTLFLNNLESGDVVGDKVEIIAKYCSVGKPKNNVLEGIVGQALAIPEVVSAGWEVL